MSWVSAVDVVGWIVTLGLLSIDVMVVSGVTDVILTEDERDKACGRDTGRGVDTDEVMDKDDGIDGEGDGEVHDEVVTGEEITGEEVTG